MIETLTLADLCRSRTPLSLPPDAPVSLALATMGEQQQSAVVVAAAGCPVGIFTQRDALGLVTRGRYDPGTPLRDLMSPDPVTALPQTTFLEGYTRLAGQGCRHLVLADAQGRFRGLLSENDFARALGALAPAPPSGLMHDRTARSATQVQPQAPEDALGRYTFQLEELMELVNLPRPPLEHPLEQVRALLRLGYRSLGMMAAVLQSLDGGPRVLAAVGAPGPQGRMPQLERPALESFLHPRGQPRVLGSEDLPAAILAAGFGSCIGLAFDSPHPDGPPATLLLILWSAEPSLDLGGPERQILRLIAQRVTALRHEARIQRDLAATKERETIGHLASGVAHDLNNLLGVLDANLAYLETRLHEQGEDPELARALHGVQSALGQAKVVTSGMLSLDQTGSIPLESVELVSTVAELVRILARLLPPTIRLRVRVPAGLSARSNRGFLQAALLNLVLNARDAMPNGGDLEIAVQPATSDPQAPLRVGQVPAGDGIEVTVTDTGSGMRPEVIAHIFEPLYSTKPKQRGHGFGLFMVEAFVTRSGAGLTVSSHPGAGSCFSLLLPRAESSCTGVAPH